jgi:hypothetical protein
MCEYKLPSASVSMPLKVNTSPPGAIMEVFNSFMQACSLFANVSTAIFATAPAESSSCFFMELGAKI